MIEKIPDEVRHIHQAFLNEGFEIYLVGGCVRDLFLNRPVKDWDFTTNATPEEILKLFPDGFYDNSFGTVGIPTKINDAEDIVEVTTYRTEKDYEDNRHPQVAWGTSIEEDLKRRDFSINAIALGLETRSGLLEETIIDPYDGQKDLVAKIIRAVGNPEERFNEDALRLMRAIRLATTLAFSIDPETLAAIEKTASLLKNISGERIRDELMRILASDFPYEGIVLLKNTGLLHFILPELLEGIGVSQERPGRHHKTDVFTHNIESLRHCPSTDPIVRFATLIHDVGKPKVAAKDEEGYIIFHNHEIEGARLAYQISERLRLSKKDRQKVVTLVRWHMFTVDESATDAAVRRFIRRIGVENVKDMIDLRIGDRLGSGTETAESWRLKLFKKRIEEQLAPAPFSINDLAIDGHDVMEILKVKPGPEIGKLLQKLFEEVDEDLSKNTKAFLTDRVLSLAKEL